MSFFFLSSKCVPLFFIFVSSNFCWLLWLVQGTVAPAHSASVQTARHGKHLPHFLLCMRKRSQKKNVSGEDLHLYASPIVADFKYEFSDVLLLFVNSIMHLFKKKKKRDLEWKRPNYLSICEKILYFYRKSFYLVDLEWA